MEDRAHQSPGRLEARFSIEGYREKENVQSLS